jgi:hypothetical protein
MALQYIIILFRISGEDWPNTTVLSDRIGSDSMKIQAKRKR